MLNPLPFLCRVAGLDPVTAAVLVSLAVKLAPLAATLVEEGADSYTAWVLCIAIAMRNL